MVEMDRMGKSNVLTEVANDPEKVELSDRLDKNKTMMLPKLASEDEQLELEDTNTVLGSCSQPSGSGDEPDDEPEVQQRKHNLEMASRVDSGQAYE